MFAAVERPREPSTVGRHLKSKAGIGDDVDPWRGCRLAGPENSHVFTAFTAPNPPSHLKNCRSMRRGSARRRYRSLSTRFIGRAACAWRPFARDPVDRPGRRAAPPALLAPRPVVASASVLEMRSARSTNTEPRAAVRSRLRPRQAHAHESLQCVLQILDIGHRTLVQDHQIRREALHSPIFVRLQQLADKYGDVFHGVDPQEQDAGRIA